MARSHLPSLSPVLGPMMPEKCQEDLKTAQVGEREDSIDLIGFYRPPLVSLRFPCRFPQNFRNTKAKPTDFRASKPRKVELRQVSAAGSWAVVAWALVASEARHSRLWVDAVVLCHLVCGW